MPQAGRNCAAESILLQKPAKSRYNGAKKNGQGTKDGKTHTQRWFGCFSIIRTYNIANAFALPRLAGMVPFRTESWRSLVSIHGRWSGILKQNRGNWLVGVHTAIVALAARHGGWLEIHIILTAVPRAWRATPAHKPKQPCN